ncbi:MAG: hypothetical protein NC418_00180 [Muribaculaceae bacterium]|nr:hypothetical protein [Muribaculaceae bacterium]
MLNAISKPLAACLILGGILTSCGDKDREGASAIFDRAGQAIEANDYAGALVLLDTLNTRYPAQTGIRKDALRLRAQAMQGIALDSIEASSKELAEATIRREEWNGRFRHVDSSVGLEGYYIPKGAPEKVMTATGIQPRVSDKGFFYIVANVQGRAIGLRSIELIDGAESVSSETISPARVVKVEGSESASFNPEDIEAIGPWLVSHPGASKIVLRGSKNSASAKLSDALRTQLIECYQYAEALQAQRRASIRREKYERMLATARDQIANLPAPEQK